MLGLGRLTLAGGLLYGVRRLENLWIEQIKEPEW